MGVNEYEYHGHQNAHFNLPFHIMLVGNEMEWNSY